MNKLTRTLLSLAAAILACGQLFAASPSVTLAWDPNPESDIKEYRLHIGTSSRGYEYTIPVGLVTTYTVLDLPPGNEFYFALTAVNQAGFESDHSEEVLYLPPAEGGRLALQQSASTFQVSLNGLPATTYAIMASANLRDWTVISTKLSDASGLITITADRAQQGLAQFFRAVKLP